MLELYLVSVLAIQNGRVHRARRCGGIALVLCDRARKLATARVNVDTAPRARRRRDAELVA